MLESLGRERHLQNFSIVRYGGLRGREEDLQKYGNSSALSGQRISCNSDLEFKLTLSMASSGDCVDVSIPRGSSLLEGKVDGAADILQLTSCGGLVRRAHQANTISLYTCPARFMLSSKSSSLYSPSIPSTTA